MPSLAERIQGLTPEQLVSFRRYLPGRLALMPSQDRQRAIRELSVVSGFEDISTGEEPRAYQPPRIQEEPDYSPWQRFVGAAGKVAGFMEEKMEPFRYWYSEPAAAQMAAPIEAIKTLGRTGRLEEAMETFGGLYPYSQTPLGLGLGLENTWRGEYEKLPEAEKIGLEIAAEVPLYIAGGWGLGVAKGAITGTSLAARTARKGLAVAGAIERKPRLNATRWNRLAVPERTAIAEELGLKGEVGVKAWAGLTKTEKTALTAKTIPTVTTKTYGAIPDLQDIDEAIRVATEPSFFRKIANLPGMGRISRLYGGLSANPRTDAERAFVGLKQLMAESENKIAASTAKLRTLGSPKTLFQTGDDGLIQLPGKLKGLEPNTIATYPKKYAQYLNPEQTAYIDEVTKIYKGIGDLYERAGIKVNKLQFEEDGLWIGRRVWGKYGSDNTIESLAIVTKGQARRGLKAAFEKVRVFETPEEAVKEGFVYFDLTETAILNSKAAYNRVAIKKTNEWLFERVPFRVASGPEGLRDEVGLLRQAVRSDREALRKAGWKLGATEKELTQLHKETYISVTKAEQLASAITTQEALKANVSILRSSLRASKKIADWLARRYSKVAGRDETAYKRVLDVQKRLDERLTRLDEIEPLWKKALEDAKRVHWGEASLADIPAFARTEVALPSGAKHPVNIILTGPEAQATASFIREQMHPYLSKALNAVNMVNAVGRYFALAGDVSPGLIQMIFLMGYKPKVYVQAMKGFLHAMKDPKWLPKYKANHSDTLMKSTGILQMTEAGATEATEAFARYGLLQKRGLGTLARPLKPFMRGFEAAMDVAGIELRESLNYMCTTPSRTAAVESFINEIRGLANTNIIGVSPYMRQIERASILAPQYFRSIIALLTDVARGGVRGRLAREALGKGIAAIAAITVGISYAMGEDEDEIIQHLNPTSKTFMTWQIAGQNIGPGSKVRSLLKLYGNISQRPENAAYYAFNFLRGNFAPVVGTGYDIISGKNYAGDPSRDGVLSATRTILGENMLPIWVQSVLLEGDLGEVTPEGIAARAAAEFMGMRAYPQSPWQVRDTLRDELARRDYGMSWDDLASPKGPGKLAQIELERKYPELKEATEKAEEELIKVSRGEGKVWNEWRGEGERIERYYQNAINLAAREFEQTRDGITFREKVDQISSTRRDMHAERDSKSEYDIVRAYFNEPINAETRAKMNPNDLARREYYNQLYAPDMYDEFGNYRFEEADRRREAFIQRYGQEAMDYIEDYMGARWDEPKALKSLRDARKTLKLYWGIENIVWSHYPPELRELAEQVRLLERINPELAREILKRIPQLLYARKIIAEVRKKLKDANPYIQWALATFYGY